jgi:hypothetical protein
MEPTGTALAHNAMHSLLALQAAHTLGTAAHLRGFHLTIHHAQACLASTALHGQCAGSA